MVVSRLERRKHVGADSWSPIGSPTRRADPGFGGLPRADQRTHGRTAANSGSRLSRRPRTSAPDISPAGETPGGRAVSMPRAQETVDSLEPSPVRGLLMEHDVTVTALPVRGVTLPPTPPPGVLLGLARQMMVGVDRGGVVRWSVPPSSAARPGRRGEAGSLLREWVDPRTGRRWRGPFTEPQSAPLPPTTGSGRTLLRRLELAAQATGLIGGRSHDCNNTASANAAVDDHSGGWRTCSLDGARPAGGRLCGGQLPG